MMRKDLWCIMLLLHYSATVTESEEQSKLEPVYVIVSGLGRSGSTLLMNLLTLSTSSLQPTISYYEPFHDEQPSVSEDEPRKIPDLTWNSMFDCKLSTISREGLLAILWHGQGRSELAEQLSRRENFHWYFEKESRHFVQKKNLTDLELTSDWFKLSDAADKLQQFCQESKFRMVKTIRMLGYVRKELPLDKLEQGKLKVIHLVRNPLDVSKSFKSFAEQEKWSMTIGDDYDDKICTRTLNEATFFEREVQANYPQHFMTVKYEEIKQKPSSTMEEILKFLGLPWGTQQQHDIAVAMQQIRGPTYVCSGDLNCPLIKENSGKLRRKRTKAWPMSTACDATLESENNLDDMPTTTTKHVDTEPVTLSPICEAVFQRFQFRSSTTLAGRIGPGELSGSVLGTEYVQLRTAAYGQTELRVRQLRAYAHRFEAVLDQSSSFQLYEDYLLANNLEEYSRQSSPWQTITQFMYSELKEMSRDLDVPESDIFVSVLVMLACDTLDNIAILTAPRLQTRIKKWSIVKKPSSKGGNYMLEYYYMYHRPMLARMLPESVGVVDYVAKYREVTEIAESLMWQYRWEVATMTDTQ